MTLNDILYWTGCKVNTSEGAAIVCRQANDMVALALDKDPSRICWCNIDEIDTSTNGLYLIREFK